MSGHNKSQIIVAKHWMRLPTYPRPCHFNEIHVQVAPDLSEVGTHSAIVVKSCVFTPK